MDWIDSFSCQNCAVLKKQLELFDLLKQKCHRTDEIAKNLLTLKKSHEKSVKIIDLKTKKLTEARGRLRSTLESLKCSERKVGEHQLRIVSLDTRIHDLEEDVAHQRSNCSILSKEKQELMDILEQKDNELTSLKLLSTQVDEKHNDEMQKLQSNLEKVQELVKIGKKDLQIQSNLQATYKKKYDKLVSLLIDVFKDGEVIAERITKLKRVARRLQSQENAAKLEAELNSPTLTPDGATSLDTGIFSGDEDIPSLENDLEVSSESSDDDFEDVKATVEDRGFNGKALKNRILSASEPNFINSFNSVVTVMDSEKNAQSISPQNCDAISNSSSIEDLDSTLCPSLNGISDEVVDQMPSLCPIDSSAAACTPSNTFTTTPLKYTEKSPCHSESAQSLKLSMSNSNVNLNATYESKSPKQLSRLTSPIASPLKNSTCLTIPPVKSSELNEVSPEGSFDNRNQPESAHSALEFPFSSSKTCLNSTSSPIDEGTNRCNSSLIDMSKDCDSDVDLDVILGEWNAPTPVMPFSEDSSSFDGKNSSSELQFESTATERAVNSTLPLVSLIPAAESSSNTEAANDTINPSNQDQATQLHFCNVLKTSVGTMTQQVLCVSTASSPIFSSDNFSCKTCSSTDKSTQSEDEFPSKCLRKTLKDAATSPQKMNVTNRAVSPVKHYDVDNSKALIEKLKMDIATSPVKICTKSCGTSPIRCNKRDVALSPIKIPKKDAGTSTVSGQQTTILDPTRTDKSIQTTLREDSCHSGAELRERGISLITDIVNSSQIFHEGTQISVENHVSDLTFPERNSLSPQDTLNSLVHSKEAELLHQVLEVLGINESEVEDIRMDKTLIGELRCMIEMTLRKANQDLRPFFKRPLPSKLSTRRSFCTFQPCELEEICNQQHYNLHLLAKSKSLEERMCSLSSRNKLKIKRLKNSKRRIAKNHPIKTESLNQSVESLLPRVSIGDGPEETAKRILDPTSSPLQECDVSASEIACAGPSDSEDMDSSIKIAEQNKTVEKPNVPKPNSAPSQRHQRNDEHSTSNTVSPAANTTPIDKLKSLDVDNIYRGSEAQPDDEIIVNAAEPTSSVSSQVELHSNKQKHGGIPQQPVNGTIVRTSDMNRFADFSSSKEKCINEEKNNGMSGSGNSCDKHPNVKQDSPEMPPPADDSRASTRALSKKRHSRSSESSSAECVSDSDNVVAVRRSPRTKKVRVAHEWDSGSKQSYQRGYMKFVKGETVFVKTNSVGSIESRSADPTIELPQSCSITSSAPLSSEEKLNSTNVISEKDDCISSTEKSKSLGAVEMPNNNLESTKVCAAASVAKRIARKKPTKKTRKQRQSEMVAELEDYEDDSNATLTIVADTVNTAEPTCDSDVSNATALGQNNDHISAAADKGIQHSSEFSSAVEIPVLSTEQCATVTAAASSTRVTRHAPTETVCIRRKFGRLAEFEDDHDDSNATLTIVEDTDDTAEQTNDSEVSNASAPGQNNDHSSAAADERIQQSLEFSSAVEIPVLSTELCATGTAAASTKVTRRAPTKTVGKRHKFGMVAELEDDDDDSDTTLTIVEDAVHTAEQTCDSEVSNVTALGKNNNHSSDVADEGIQPSLESLSAVNIPNENLKSTKQSHIVVAAAAKRIARNAPTKIDCKRRKCGMVAELEDDEDDSDTTLTIVEDTVHTAEQTCDSEVSNVTALGKTTIHSSSAVDGGTQQSLESSSTVKIPIDNLKSTKLSAAVVAAAAKRIARHMPTETIRKRRKFGMVAELDEDENDSHATLTIVENTDNIGELTCDSEVSNVTALGKNNNHSNAAVDEDIQQPSVSSRRTRTSLRKQSKLQKMRSRVSKIHPLAQVGKSPRSRNFEEDVEEEEEVGRSRVLCSRYQQSEVPVVESGGSIPPKAIEMNSSAQTAILDKFRGIECRRLAAAASGRTAQLIQLNQVRGTVPRSNQASKAVSAASALQTLDTPVSTRRQERMQPLVRPEDRVLLLKAVPERKKCVEGTPKSCENMSDSQMMQTKELPRGTNSSDDVPDRLQSKKESQSGKDFHDASFLIPAHTIRRVTNLSPMAYAIIEQRTPQFSPCDKNELAKTEKVVKETLKSFVAATSFTPEVLQKAIVALSAEELYNVLPVIVRDVVNMVNEDHDSQPLSVPGRQNSFVPSLTPVQQQLVTLVLQLSFQNKHLLQLPHQVLSLIEFRVFRLGRAPEENQLIWLSKLHASICRALCLRSQALIFCWDAQYALRGRAYEVVEAVVEVWPYLLPVNPSFHEACPNAQVLLHLLNSHSEKQLPPGVRQKKFDNSWLKRLLKRLQAVNVNSSTLCTTIFSELIGGGSVMNVTALVLLAKREEEKWTLSDVVSGKLLPALDKWRAGSLNDQAGERVIWTLCSILRALQFDRCGGIVNTVIKLLKSDLLNKESSAAFHMREVTAIGLALLSRHDIENIAVALMSWVPEHGLSTGFAPHLIEQLKSLVNNGVRPIQWWEKLLTRLSKAPQEELSIK